MNVKNGTTNKKKRKIKLKAGTIVKFNGIDLIAVKDTDGPDCSQCYMNNYTDQCKKYDCYMLHFVLHA